MLTVIKGNNIFNNKLNNESGISDQLRFIIRNYNLKKKYYSHFYLPQ